MKVPVDLKYTQELLRDAIEMLQDMQDKLGMFQRQRYRELKKRFDQQVGLSEDLSTALNDIDTEG